ncbi:MAG: AI-2E family transporter, partial [Oscillospiraceae bacterium]
IIILQQIECNLIYPHVVGGHIGLPALWVAVGVFVGGSLFGLWGMLLSLPTVSVVYTLVREATKKRLAIKVKKLSANPIVKFRNNTLH